MLELDVVLLWHRSDSKKDRVYGVSVLKTDDEYILDETKVVFTVLFTNMCAKYCASSARSWMRLRLRVVIVYVEIE